jgi:hypothetical protein
VAVDAKTQLGLTLPIDLRGKRAFVAGVADDQGFGWAISKSLAQAGCEVILGTWVPALNIFESSYRCVTIIRNPETKKLRSAFGIPFQTDMDDNT